MSVSLCNPEIMSIREMALDLFKNDDTLATDFIAEIKCDCVPDELLKETGCWDEAVAQMQEAMHS